MNAKGINAKHTELLRVDEVEHRDVDASGDCVARVLPEVLEHFQVAHDDCRAAGERDAVEVSVRRAVVLQLLKEWPLIWRQVPRGALRRCCTNTQPQIAAWNAYAL